MAHRQVVKKEQGLSARFVPIIVILWVATCHSPRSACGVGNLTPLVRKKDFPYCAVGLPLRGNDRESGE